MKIRFLGTGNIATSRKCTSVLFDDHILFDIGFGVVDALRENNIALGRIDTLIISHFHADHIGDIMYFIARRFAKKETEMPLTIIAPPKAKEVIKKYIDAHIADYLEDKNLLDYFNKILGCVIELKDNETYKECKAFAVEHGGSICNGYLFNVGNVKIGCSGDTTLCKSIENNIKNADIWIIDGAGKDKDYKGISRHLTEEQVTKFAEKFTNKKFYLVHRGNYLPNSNCKNMIYPFDNGLYLENIKAVIFDLDGTLVDTDKDAGKMYKDFFASIDNQIPNIDKWFYENAVGFHSGEIYEMLKKEFDIKIGKDEYFDEFKKFRIEFIKKHPIVAKEGAIEILQWLKSKGIKIALCTGSWHDATIQKFKSCGIDENLFDAIVDGNMTDELKPSPKPYLLTLEKLKLKANVVIAIEDSDVGVISAMNASIDTILIPDIRKNSKEAKDKAITISNSLTQIKALFSL